MSWDVPRPRDGCVRIVTWNVWWRYGERWEARQEAIAATLATWRPDVVTLQESFSPVADDERGRPLNRPPDAAATDDQPARLAAAVDLPHVRYAARLVKDGGLGFGNAILSRWPVGRVETRELPDGGVEPEQRLVLAARLDRPGGALCVATTHLNYRLEHSAVRQAQARTVAGLLADWDVHGLPPVVTGDLNAESDSDELRLLTGRAAAHRGIALLDGWHVAGDDESRAGSATWWRRNALAEPSGDGDRRIDYVLVGYPNADGRGRVEAAHRVGAVPVEVDGTLVWASDHLGVAVDVRVDAPS